MEACRRQGDAVGIATERSRLTRFLVLASALCAMAVFVALGIWQIHRREWKLDLIARVEDRVHARPVAVPGPSVWASVTADRDEYRRVEITGRFLAGHDTFSRAVTDFGPGYWVMMPFRADEGFTVLVNRGFVPEDVYRARRDTIPEAAGTAVTGLLRLSEPHGGFLRTNDPGQDRWYSRDVAAIAAARGLGSVAPFFIDAEASGETKGWPRAGLTVISFPNNHLVYAVTWFGLALLVAGTLIFRGSDPERISCRSQGDRSSDKRSVIAQI